MRTGKDDGAREEGGPLGEEGDELRDGEDHVGGVGRLHHLAVHRAAQLQRCAQQRTLGQSGQQQRAERGWLRAHERMDGLRARVEAGCPHR